MRSESKIKARDWLLKGNLREWNKIIIGIVDSEMMILV